MGRWRSSMSEHSHSSFRKPRLTRYESRVRSWVWLRRALLTALAVAACWVLWQSWIGLRIFDN